MSQSISICFRFLSASLRLHLSPRLMRVSLVPYVRGISMVSEKQIYRASFRTSGTLSIPLGRSGHRSMWPVWNRRIRCLRFTSSFFSVFFLPPLRTSCRYVEFFMNTLQTIHSQRESRRMRVRKMRSKILVLSSSIFDV